ncbi:hypothetical protein ACET3Z_018463 [Daucus carota]
MLLIGCMISPSDINGSLFYNCLSKLISDNLRNSSRSGYPSKIRDMIGIRDAIRSGLSNSSFAESMIDLSESGDTPTSD